MGKTLKMIRKRTAWLSKTAVHAAGLPLVLVILGAAIPIAYSLIHHSLTAPPGIGTVTRLMNEESRAAKAHDVNVASRIYARGAVVTDAGCQTPGASHSWVGRAEIKARYRALPTFLSLHHVNARVFWDPDNRQATTADVTADTIGVLGPSAGSQARQPIAGHELWTFALFDGRWLVTSFTYNLCLPASNGR